MCQLAQSVYCGHKTNNNNNELAWHKKCVCMRLSTRACVRVRASNDDDAHVFSSVSEKSRHRTRRCCICAAACIVFV